MWRFLINLFKTKNQVTREEQSTCTTHANGTQVWRNVNNQLHRTDGPAIEWASGLKEWYLNGQCHRTDGPAMEWPNGDKKWYLNGHKLTEEIFNKKTRKIENESKNKNQF